MKLGIAHLVIGVCMIISGFVARGCAKRIDCNLSIVAGLACGFSFYLFLMLLDVDGEDLGMVLGLAFPGLFLLFAAAGWIGVQSPKAPLN